MKKIFTVLAIVLFTINVGAQEAKPAAKGASKKESCTAKQEAKTMTADEIAKCQAKCKAEGKECTAGDMTNCKSQVKSCCAKK